MTKKVSKGKKPQKMSVSQFKMWIQGLSEFQDDDWVPNVNQWNLIRERIDMLDEEAQSVIVHQAPQHYVANAPQQVTLPNQNTGVTTVQTVATPAAPVARFQQPIIGAGSSAGFDENGKPITESNSPSAFI